MTEPDNNPDNLELIDPALLPPQARMLVKILGIEDALRLLQARGGLPTHVPVTGNSEVLLAIISQAAINKLIEAGLGGTELQLPKADKALRQLRDIAIKKACESQSYSEVAKRVNLTRRRVIMIAGEHDDDPTEDMFG